MSAAMGTIGRRAGVLGHRSRRRLGTWVVRFGLAVFVVLALGPIAWGVVTSLLPTRVLTQSPPDLSLANLTLANYVEVLTTRGSLVDALIDSAVVATLTASISLALGSAAAYALARLRVPGGDRIMLAVLATQMFPGIVIAIPLFLIFSQLRLIDTYPALSLTYLSFTLPVVIWILKGFFETIPPQLERAAAVDGASTFQTFRMVILPISLPGLAAVAVFIFLESWNEFLFSSVLISSKASQTFPVGLYSVAGTYGDIRWGETMAAAAVGTIPVFTLFLAFQRWLVSGLTSGAVKG